MSVSAAGSLKPGAPEPPPSPVTVDLPAGGDRTILLPTGFYYVTAPRALAMPPGGFAIEQVAVEPPDFTLAF